MIIESVRLQHFRCVQDEILSCNRLTALVGANGCGKSSFLRALELFYGPSPKLQVDDCYNEQDDEEVVITVTYAALSDEAKQHFQAYVQDQKLSVACVLRLLNGKTLCTYHGTTLQCPEFKGIREGLLVKDRGATAKAAYNTLLSTSDYSALRPWSNLGAVDESLRTWESEHPDMCVRSRDNGQFFGFREVGTGYLGRYSKFLFIPAVRDASDDAEEGRGSVISDLMDLVVRSVLSNKESVKALKEQTQTKYKDVLDPSKIDELNHLSRNLTKTLQVFVPDSEVSLAWLPLAEIDIPMPKATVRLAEDGYKSAVSKTGHGLQRAFILTMLQHLVLAKSALAEGTDNPVQHLPDLVLAIEEPELYQHPNRQRHFARVLRDLAAGSIPGVAERTQILYGTHSPLFVGIDRIEEIRLLRKYLANIDEPKVARISLVSLSDVAERTWQVNGAHGEPFSAATLLPRLQAIMTPWMNEGFFADVVVLVEGEDDRAAILATARALDKDLEANGISVIPCFGKTNIDRPFIIFSTLGIPVYAIWDADAERGETEGICETCLRPLDKKPDPRDNRVLLRLVGATEEDWPQALTSQYACFRKNLETTMRSEIGAEVFDEQLEEHQQAFGIARRNHAIKNPTLLAHVLTSCQQRGHESSTLRKIVEAILQLKVPT